MSGPARRRGALIIDAACQTTDVAIIGGGIMGSAVALRLAQRGRRGHRPRARHPGAEASSAAAGILGPQMEAEGPGPLLDLGLRSRALYPARRRAARATGIDIGYDRSGVLAVALDDAGEHELRDRRAWQTRAACAPSCCGRRGARARAGAGARVRAALRISRRRAGQRARAGARVLAGGRAAGARFLHGRYVRRVVDRGGAATGVELDGETLPAGTVVVAAGSWSGLVEGGGVPAAVVRPARGQMVAIETRPPLFRHVVSCTAGYLVPRRDGPCWRAAPSRWSASASR